jgi:putative ABC transport system substrate-binding protein
VWPLPARAQQAAIPVIGFLGSESADLWANELRAFQQGLRETSYVEGRNVAIEYLWAEGQNDRVPSLTNRRVAGGASDESRAVRQSQDCQGAQP